VALCDHIRLTIALVVALPGGVVTVVSVPIWSVVCMSIMDIYVTPSGAADDGKQEESSTVTHSDSVCPSRPDRLRDLHPSITLVAAGASDLLRCCRSGEAKRPSTLVTS
jgi:hypothetical protein